MDEFLIFGKPIADPWHRVCSLREPLLLMVEFCQIQGPRPLYSYPLDVCSPHLLEEISVWLMSSENSHGNYSQLYNQQLGVHVLVQYATMLDITARALQRPFAVALILVDSPNAEQIMSFKQLAAEMLLPMLCCNRNYIQSVLNFATQMVEDTELRNIQSYYSTAGNAQQIVILSNKIKGIVHQCKPWYENFMEKVYANAENGCACQCGREDFQKFVQILSRKQPELVALMELAPCGAKNYQEIMIDGYKKCINFQQLPKSSEGLMFSGKMPIIRSLFCANSQYDCSDDEQNLQRNREIPISHFALIGAENSLQSLSFRLVRCIYPLLSGEKILILASKQRVITGIDLLNKLNEMRVAKRSEKVDWLFTSNGLDELAGSNQVSGLSLDRTKSLELGCPAAEHDFVVIDLNNHRIRSREYAGKLLAQLSGTRAFPSDKAVMAFMASKVADIFQLVLLAKFISPEFVVNRFELSPQDQIIFFNLLIEFDLTKYIRLKAKVQEIQAASHFGIQRF